VTEKAPLGSLQQYLNHTGPWEDGYYSEASESEKGSSDSEEEKKELEEEEKKQFEEEKNEQ
jgi:hypothetical protein